MSQAFFQAYQQRRTYYGLKAEASVPDSKIVELVQEAVKYTPSAFNTQTGRAVVLFGEASKKIWKTVEEFYLPNFKNDEKALADNKGKLTSFASGYGTIAFFEDQDIIQHMQKTMPFLSSSFPIWSENSTGMLQCAVWTALAVEGMGASLQHYAAYSEEFTPAALKAMDISGNWKCTALMPFGVPAGPPGNPAHPKDFKPIEDRVKVFHSL